MTKQSLLLLYKTTVSLFFLSFGACATITEEKTTPITVSFSDDSEGKCTFVNKRGSWTMAVPGVVNVRKSDDSLTYNAVTNDGRSFNGEIDSKMGYKIFLSVFLLDFGITDSITDKHRKYTPNFEIPVNGRQASSDSTQNSSNQGFEDKVDSFVDDFSSSAQEGSDSVDEFEFEDFSSDREETSNSSSKSSTSSDDDFLFNDAPPLVDESKATNETENFSSGSSSSGSSNDLNDRRSSNAHSSASADSIKQAKRALMSRYLKKEITKKEYVSELRELEAANK